MTDIPPELMQKFSTDAMGGHPNVTPKDASTLILLDRSGAEPKVLMGKRHDRHVFMPGAYVFPGGRVDPIDRTHAGRGIARSARRTEADGAHQTPQRRQGARAGARRRPRDLRGDRAAARRQGIRTPAKPDNAWAAFVDAGILPDLSTMHFVARAVTPPRRKRRYDTRFFTADASTIAHRIDGKVGADFELVELVWLPLSEVKQRIELMAITEIVLRELTPSSKRASATICRSLFPCGPRPAGARSAIMPGMTAEPAFP